MKSLTKDRIIAGIGAISIAIILPLITNSPAFAKINSIQGSNLELANNKQNMTEEKTSPSALVSEAYRGNFKEQGISGFGTLIQEYQDKEVAAKDVVQAGIDSGKLAPTALENSGYMEAVENELSLLLKNK